MWQHSCKPVFLHEEIAIRQKNDHMFVNFYFAAVWSNKGKENKPFIKNLLYATYFTCYLRSTMLVNIHNNFILNPGISPWGSVKHVLGYKANKKQSQGLNPGFFLTPTSECFSFQCHFPQVQMSGTSRSILLACGDAGRAGPQHTLLRLPLWLQHYRELHTHAFVYHSPHVSPDSRKALVGLELSSTAVWSCL